MMASTTSTSYTAVAKTLHWLIALLIVGMLVLGWTMTDMPKGPDKFYYYQLHKSIGITILMLSLFRLVWRLMHTPPALPQGMKPWEIRTAKYTHILFYVLIIGIPLTGWVIVSASPLSVRTMLFGIIPWPHLPIIPSLTNKRDLAHFFEDVHCYLAYTIAILLGLHIGAGLKHHFINHDDVLVRMMPSFLSDLLQRWGGQK